MMDDMVSEMFLDPDGVMYSNGNTTGQEINMADLEKFAVEFEAENQRRINQLCAIGGRRIRWPDLSFSSMVDWGEPEKDNATMFFFSGVGMVVIPDALGKDTLFVLARWPNSSVGQDEFMEAVRNHSAPQPK